MIKKHDSSKSPTQLETPVETQRETQMETRREVKAVMTTLHSTNISASNSAMSSAVSSAMNLTGNSTTMNAEYIDQYDVIQRYLYRALSEAELSAFEIYLLCHPELIADIEQQKVINNVFREELSKDKRWLRQSIASAPALPHSLWRRATPLVACMLFAFYVGVNSQISHQSREVLKLDAVVLQSLRGSQTPYDIRLSALHVAPSLSSVVEVPLHIDVGPQLESNQRYHLRLWQPSTGIVLANVEQLQIAPSGWLDYSVDVSANLRGQFQLEVSKLADRDQQHFQVLFQ
jgi:hypothetical protein